MDGASDFECRFDLDADAWPGGDAAGTLTRDLRDVRNIQGVIEISARRRGNNKEAGSS